MAFNQQGHSIPINVSGILYQMIDDYEPQVDSCMRCLRNQTIFVQKPFVFEFQGTERKPTGWLYGLNMDTNESGYIPAEFAQFNQFIYRQINSPTKSFSTSSNLPAVPEIDQTSDSRTNYVPVTITSQNENENQKQAGKSDLKLEDQNWYWGKVSKDEVNAALNGTTDGSFLVRDSQDAGCYTLTLRKNGTNKLIKIHQEGGMFGFSHPFQFTSVVSLIGYYRRQSLEAYNTDLNITLKHVIRKPLISISKKENILQSLHADDVNLINSNQSLDEVCRNQNNLQNLIKKQKKAIDCFEISLSMLEDSKKTLSMNKEKLTDGQDERRILENQRKKVERIKILQKEMQKAHERLQDTQHQIQLSETRINDLQTDIIRFRSLRDSKTEYLRSMNIPDVEINSAFVQLAEDEEENIYHLPELDLEEKYPQHCKESTWYYPKFTRFQSSSLGSNFY